MTMGNGSVLDKLQTGERARLIPVGSDRQKESRAISALLAVFRLIPAYANLMLDEVGAPTNKRAKLSAWTEITFKVLGKKPSELPRPDGLLAVQSGKKEWAALVEAKVKNEEISAAQIERYLDLAREVGANAVITISNQFALLPSHHPVRVNKQKTRSVSLYHFSWLALQSNAQVLSDSDTLEDEEQALVLKELIRFLEHDNSGVKPYDRMGPAWKDLCATVQQGAPLRKGDEKLQEAVADWHQLCRYLALKLSSRLAKPVSVCVRRKHANDPAKRLEHDIGRLVKDQLLADEFDIPNAAGNVNLSADIMRRTINLSMRLEPPKDKQRPTAAINWLTRQLNPDIAKGVLIRCTWPRRTPDTIQPLETALEDPKSLIPDGMNDLPAGLEVMRVVDLAGRFRGARTLVEDIEKAFPAFYRDIGQHLRAWTPPPPKYRKSRKPVSEEEERLAEREAELADQADKTNDTKVPDSFVRTPHVRPPQE
ncbi:hypothetical protein [Natronospira bacteriovora]|uniref:Stress response protein n=1 Tax=Natronospira bacteriovora TaxID=3069753 RepID=A0ABU0W9X2_9GAMM|nr:hypothetical protein [Natronospira sp. AB-CW4]MDQ2070839.1 hypothetical protein [Natronospira sp. AB-CW4]